MATDGKIICVKSLGFLVLLYNTWNMVQKFINTSSLISGTAYPGANRAPVEPTGQSQPTTPSIRHQTQANRNLISSRFGFLSCITGFTSICLLGLTLASLAPQPGDTTRGLDATSITRICPSRILIKATSEANWDQCQVDILLKLLAFIFTFGASVEIQLRRRKNALLGCSYHSTLSAKLSDVLLLLLTGSSCFSLLALFNFVRRIFRERSVSINKNTDMSLVYLSLLFILTLFNLLTTFIYCSKSRHFLAPLDVGGLESKQDPPPNYDEVMANEKLFPIEQTTVSGRREHCTNTTEFKS